MIEQFIDKNFRAATLAQIGKANEIIAEYGRQGYTLTLRQLYYQFVSRGLIENSDRSYKALGATITDARDAGLISWNGIEDRGRGIKGWLIDEDVESILADIPSNFAVDMWANQDTYVEVWVEKDALSSVIQRACGPYRVKFMPCKGYLSASEAWRAGKRFEEARFVHRKRPLIVHLGDHDPSGIDMTRDNRERVSRYANTEVEIKRIALNMDQVEQYDPPPNPAKITDSRSDDYIARFGDTSWELDALEPNVLVELIRRAISPLIDTATWEEDLDRERTTKAKLARISERWTDVESFLDSLD